MGDANIKMALLQDKTLSLPKASIHCLTHNNSNIYIYIYEINEWINYSVEGDLISRLPTKMLTQNGWCKYQNGATSR